MIKIDNVDGRLMRIKDPYCPIYSREYHRTSRNIRMRDIIRDVLTPLLPTYQVYSVIDYDSPSISLLAHELGHIMGLSHSEKQRAEAVRSGIRKEIDNNAPGVTPYAQGYGVPGDFTTLMAYNNEFTTRTTNSFNENFDRGGNSLSSGSQRRWQQWTSNGIAPVLVGLSGWNNPGEFSPKFGPFMVSKAAVAANTGTPVADAQCKREYGNNYRLADWTDIRSAFGASGSSQSNYYVDFVNHYAHNAIKYHGREVDRGTRHFFIGYDSSPTFWSPTRGIYGTDLKVGSWPMSMRALCYDENYRYFDGQYADSEGDYVTTGSFRFADFRYTRDFHGNVLEFSNGRVNPNDGYKARLLSVDDLSINDTELSFYLRFPFTQRKSATYARYR